MKIEKIRNGYLINDGINQEAFSTLQELFQHLLLHFEGKSKNFKGDSYGEIIIKINNQNN